MKSARYGALVLGSLVLAVIITLALALMSVYGVGWFHRTTADYRGRTSAIEKTRANGDYRIAAYNEFFDLCSAVQAQEDRAQLFAHDTSPEGVTNLRAVEAVRAQLIREYNAKAARTDTEGHFRDSNLPYQLDPANQETQCAA